MGSWMLICFVTEGNSAQFSVLTHYKVIEASSSSKLAHTHRKDFLNGRLPRGCCRVLEKNRYYCSHKISVSMDFMAALGRNPECGSAAQLRL